MAIFTKISLSGSTVSETCAAQMENSEIVQIIVSDAWWTTNRLGGFRIDCDIPVCVGWTWNETGGFQVLEKDS